VAPAEEGSSGGAGAGGDAERADGVVVSTAGGLRTRRPWWNGIVSASAGVTSARGSSKLALLGSECSCFARSGANGGEAGASSTRSRLLAEACAIRWCEYRVACGGGYRAPGIMPLDVNRCVPASGARDAAPVCGA
jgi:hypothetical protein